MPTLSELTTRVYSKMYKMVQEGAGEDPGFKALWPKTERLLQTGNIKTAVQLGEALKQILPIIQGFGGSHSSIGETKMAIEEYLNHPDYQAAVAKSKSNNKLLTYIGIGVIAYLLFKD